MKVLIDLKTLKKNPDYDSSTLMVPGQVQAYISTSELIDSKEFYMVSSAHTLTGSTYKYLVVNPDIDLLNSLHKARPDALIEVEREFETITCKGNPEWLYEYEDKLIPCEHCGAEHHHYSYVDEWYLDSYCEERCNPSECPNCGESNDIDYESVNEALERKIWQEQENPQS